MSVSIETDRLLLRPNRREDIDALHTIWTDPDVRRYLWDDVVISREAAKSTVEKSIDSWRRHGFGHWVVERISRRGEPIGHCGLQLGSGPLEGNELLYGLLPDFWGKGYATEAARAALRFGFRHCGMKRIVAGADPPNAASFSVMERLGMRFEKRAMIDALEVICYQIEAGDFRTSQERFEIVSDEGGPSRSSRE